MSRIGKLPIEMPKGVKAEIAGRLLKVEGPKGKLSRTVSPQITVKLVDGKIAFTRAGESKEERALHGMERALANNMVKGVAEGFSKEMSLIGVGYRAEPKGKGFDLALGFSHPVQFDLPEGIKGTVLKEGREIFLKIEGADKQLVGAVAAKLRSLRPPEPYKGKGIRYRDEVVKLKAGKAGKK